MMYGLQDFAHHVIRDLARATGLEYCLGLLPVLE
jgi:hypothetical protein